MRKTWRAAWRDEWDGLQRITRDIRPADIATMANALVGMVAIITAARGDVTLAANLILVGILLDGVDGAIARLTGGGPLGGFLDTLADTITFAVAPAVIVVLGLDAPLWAALAVAGFFLVCVMLRLARFEALREKKHMAYFSGMSSPGGALVVAACILAGLPPSTTLALTVVAGTFMISRIRYPKLRGWLGLTGVAIIAAMLVTAWQWPAQQSIVALGLIAFMALYLFAGPYYVLTRFGPIRGDA